MTPKHAPILGLDMSTSVAHACLLSPNGQRFCASASEGTQHSHSVLPLLAGLLQQADMQWSDLKLLALGQGPGSFTGLRIAAASMAGINASLQLPMWGISSLAISSMQCAQDDTSKIWVIEDARVGEIFVGCYQHGKPLRDDVCCTLADLPQEQAAHYVCSSPVDVPFATWQQRPMIHSRAEAMAEWMYQHAPTRTLHDLGTSLAPNYLQLSQAERQLEARQHPS